MDQRPVIAVFVGTRPEAVKMAPIHLALSRRARFRPLLVDSGQHPDLVPPALADFGLKADLCLKTMRPGQSLAALAGRLMLALDAFLAREKPAAVLVQGDTTTVLAAAQAAFYGRVPLGHVEAGLRSHDRLDPFPEEMNRRAVSLAADWHFAPTETARQNLLHEGIEDKNILVSGNTVIDALALIRESFKADPPPLPPPLDGGPEKPIVLITSHRRENRPRLKNLAAALLALSQKHPEASFVYPLHPDPLVEKAVRPVLAERPNVFLIPALSYRPFVRLMEKSAFIITDSGGLQEEAPALGKPVLIFRQVTERPEALGHSENESGSRLVGTETAAIIEAASALLSRPETRTPKSFFGDGQAAGRIAAFIEERL